MARRKDPEPETLPPETVLPEEPSPVPTKPFTMETGPPSDASAEPLADPKPEAQPSPPRRPGIFAPLLGGALAAIGGFALSQFNVLGLAPPDAASELTALSAQISDARATQAAELGKLGTDVAALAGRVASLEAAPAPQAPDLSRLDTLDQRLAAIEAMPVEGGASTAALTAKLADLEQRLANLPAKGADPALQLQLDDALARLTKAEAAATARATEAEAAATAASRAMALDTLSDTIATGQPFMAELQDIADPALAEALGTMAETGVPTLASLQAGFPDAARQALKISREISADDTWSDRLVDFLASQTGARSLTPHEGTEPDAILSRAEYAISEGRVADALAELQPLDPAIKAPLDAWSAQASTYLAATAALNAARGE